MLLNKSFKTKKRLLPLTWSLPNLSLCMIAMNMIELLKKLRKRKRLALFAKATGSSENSAKKNKKRKLVDKSKKPKVQLSETKYNACEQKGYWSPECPNKSTKGKDSACKGD